MKTMFCFEVYSIQLNSIHVQPDGEVVAVKEEEEEEDGEDQEVPLLHLVRQLSPFFDHLVSCPIMFK